MPAPPPVIAKGALAAAPPVKGHVLRGGEYSNGGLHAGAGPNAVLPQIVFKPGEVPSFAEDLSGCYGLFDGERLPRRPLGRIAPELAECYDEQKACTDREKSKRVEKAREAAEVALKNSKWQVEHIHTVAKKRVEIADSERVGYSVTMDERLSRVQDHCQRDLGVADTLVENERQQCADRIKQAEDWARGVEAEAKEIVQRAESRRDAAVRRALASEEDAMQQAKEMRMRAEAAADRVRARSAARESAEDKRCAERMRVAEEHFKARCQQAEERTSQMMTQAAGREDLACRVAMEGQAGDTVHTKSTQERVAAQARAVARHRSAERNAAEEVLSRARTMAADVGILLTALHQDGWEDTPEYPELAAVHAAIAAVVGPSNAAALGIEAEEWRAAWQDAKYPTQEPLISDQQTACLPSPRTKGAGE